MNGPGATSDRDQQPLVSIVTPCLNSVRFIERTIESVLAQDYPNVEYIVMDGGSTDGTRAVLERYGGRLQYTSGRDLGAADAINKGFLRSHGSIFGWLNADDAYRPGAITAAVGHLMSAPEVGVVYGEGLWVDSEDVVLGSYPTVRPYDAAMLERECAICQPTSFIRREAFEGVGMLDLRLQSAFDYDLWIRLSRKVPFLAAPDILAVSRMHKDNKSLGQRPEVFKETIGLMRKHYGYVPVNWIYGYLSFLRDGRDQYFEPLRHSGLVYLASLLVGSCYNGGQLWRYWREWRSRISIQNMQRASGTKG